MSDEVSTLSSVVSFYQLLSCCSNKSEPKRPSLYVSHPDLFPVTVPLRLSSLLPHSRAVGLVLPAFAGASGERAVCVHCLTIELLGLVNAPLDGH